jgi:Uma2 family endonuclease
MKTRVTTAFTKADYFALPEGFPAQLFGGMLLKDAVPDYDHQTLGTVILLQVARLVGARRTPLCPVAVVIDEANVFHPDVVVLRSALPPGSRDVGIPLVVFEILSPSTARRDRGLKRRRYLEAGVEEVWLVDRASGTVEVHDRSGAPPRAAKGPDEVRSRALPGFSLTPATLFAEPS